MVSSGLPSYVSALVPSGISILAAPALKARFCVKVTIPFSLIEPFRSNSLGVGVGLGVGTGVGVGIGVGLGVDVGLGVPVGLGVTSGVAVGLGLGVGVGIAVGLGVATGVGLGVRVTAGNIISPPPSDCIAEKLAVTVLLPFMVREVLAELGSATSPVQLTNCHPLSGVAVMLTTSPS